MLYAILTTRSDTTVIKSILEQQIGKNKFAAASDVDVSDVQDIKYIVRGYNHIVIYYGKKHVINVTESAMKSDTFVQLLNRIGIVIKQHTEDNGDQKFLVTYWGDTVQQYEMIGGE